MSKRYIRIYMIAWTNPYTEPPKGMPRTVETIESETCPEAWTVEYRLERYGRGYGICCTARDTKPRRQMSTAGKGKIRVARMTARITKKFPLFAAQMIEEELTKDPGYYSGKENLPLKYRLAEKRGDQ